MNFSSASSRFYVFCLCRCAAPLLGDCENSSTCGQDPMGFDGLRVLRESCAGAVFWTFPTTRGKRETVFYFVLIVQISDVRNTSGAKPWAGARSRRWSARTKPGAVSSAGGDGDADRRGFVVGDAVHAMAIGRHVACDHVHGFCGRLGDVGHQTDRGVKDYGTLIEGHGG